MEQRPEFNEEFLVGIEQIDREHRRLFEIAGKVHDALVVGTDDAISAARAAVEELLDYTSTHFANEEALMEAAGYPELDAHKKLHRHLLSHARDMSIRAEGGDHYVPVDLSQFLYGWLVDHIQANDKKFGEFQRQEGSPVAAR